MMYTIILSCVLPLPGPCPQRCNSHLCRRGSDRFRHRRSSRRRYAHAAYRNGRRRRRCRTHPDRRHRRGARCPFSPGMGSIRPSRCDSDVRRHISSCQRCGYDSIWWSVHSRSRCSCSRRHLHRHGWLYPERCRLCSGSPGRYIHANGCLRPGSNRRRHGRRNDPGQRNGHSRKGHRWCPCHQYRCGQPC